MLVREATKLAVSLSGELCFVTTWSLGCSKACVCVCVSLFGNVFKCLPCARGLCRADRDLATALYNFSLGYCSQCGVQVPKWESPGRGAWLPTCQNSDFQASTESEQMSGEGLKSLISTGSPANSGTTLV